MNKEENIYWENDYSYKENKYYKKYEVERDKIKEKYKDIIVGNVSYAGKPPKGGYPPYTDKERNKHRKYLKELGDLMYKSNGNFQKFIWDDLSQVDKEARERTARGRKRYEYL
jgi:hypothetical protein